LAEIRIHGKHAPKRSQTIFGSKYRGLITVARTHTTNVTHGLHLNKQDADFRSTSTGDAISLGRQKAGLENAIRLCKLTKKRNSRAHMPADVAGYKAIGTEREL
jgi:hypothetical protein